jgi:uncharacterized protein
MTALALQAPPERLAPVVAAERVVLLDVLRGLALYGVLLANMVWFDGIAFLPREEVAARSSKLDEVAVFLIRIFVDGKAITLFSFLFGLGFAIQLDRAAARGQDGLPLYLRRLAILLALGAGHVLLLWCGDILWMYALVGFLMVPFRRLSTRTLLGCAAALAFLPPMAVAIPAVERQLHRLAFAPDDVAFRAQVLAALRGSDRAELVRMQVRQVLHHASARPLSCFAWPLARFLVGYVVGRSRLLHDAAARLPFFRKLLGWGLGIGLACSVGTFVKRAFVRRGGTFPVAVDVALAVPDELGILALAAAYTAALVLLMERPAWRRRLMRLAPVGQMALSNYLTQSLVCTFLFYGWGLGLIGKVGTAVVIPLTLAIFGVQMVVSRAWLSRFRFGPVEWLWRTLAYGGIRNR